MCRRILIVIWLTYCSTTFAQAQTLVLATEEYPPFNMTNQKTNEITGISTDKVIELMRRADEKYNLKVYSWSRAFMMGQKEANTCVYSTTRTPERETLFKWVGPLVKNNWVVFAKVGDTRKPKTLEDLRPYVMGTYRNDAVERFLKLEGFKVDTANYDADNPKKLLYGRFDFWATGELLGLEILREQGLKNQVVPLFTFSQTEMYLACNPDMAQTHIDKLNQILKEMEKDGTSAAIERKYK